VNGYRPSIRYGFVRARQLEGTFPGDKQTGVWPITGLRVSYGWGAPPEESWPYGNDWPPVEPVGIDLLAKNHRVGPYGRVRTVAECTESVISDGPGLLVSLDITERWASPPAGRIPAPSAKDVYLGTHAISLDAYDSARREFKFWNNWGDAWGDQGYGYISDEVLEATWWEGWRNIPCRSVNTAPTGVFPYPRAWPIKKSDGSTAHWLELIGEEDERVAWVSGVEHGANLEIEELFVRPKCRGVGHGKRLMGTMYNFAKDRHLSFRLWISTADTAPHNLAVIQKMAKPAGLSIQASGVRWAPLVVAPVSERRTEPAPTSPPTFPYPERPPSVFPGLAMFASTVLTGLGTSLLATVIYEIIKSWFDAKSGNRIRVKLGDVEIETSEVSPDEFLKLLKELQHVKDEAEIRAKILGAGLTITIIN